MTGSEEDAAERDPDFFVSYTRSDERWAEWIGWVLESAGYRVVIQAWDFGPGAHFVAEMHHATRRAARTVAVLSQAYQASVFAAEEWQAAWVSDPDGRARRLLAFRVEDCPRDGLLRQVVSVDLFGIDRETAKARLLAAVRGDRRKPEMEPLFPDGGGAGGGAGRVEPPMPVSPRVWRLAWSRNPNFVGRADELALVRQRFTTGAGTAAVLPQAVHGLGGVGKTQLAVEYAYRHANDYELVWWLPAEQPELVVAGLAELAGRLGLAVPGAAQESAAAAVEELRSGRRFSSWLVVADNAGAVWDLAGLLGAAGDHGHVLITSRDPGWSQTTRTVAVDVLPRAQAVTLLQARAPRLTGGEAEQVAEVLGDLPLALEQAGAWLGDSGMSTSAYLDAVGTRTREILAEGRPHTYPVPVAATWTLAMDALEETAVGLLRMWAFLGPEPILIDWITGETAAAFPGALAGVADPLVRGRTVAAVVRLGLVRLVDGAIVMHRLVQAVLRDHTPAAERDILRAAADDVLIGAAPDTTDDPRDWPRWAALYPHTLPSRIMEVDHEDCRTFIIRMCTYLDNAGNHPASQSLAESAFDQWRHLLGDDHSDTIGAASCLAVALRSLGNYSAAREMGEDVLTRCRRVLGEDHPDTITAASDLASTLWSLGEYPAAREMEEDVLTRYRRMLGEDHPYTITAAANLASTLRSVGDYPAAREMQQDVLTRYRRMLGEDHPHTITAAANLAYTLRSLGDYPAAREMQQDVLTRRCRVLGEDHPATIIAAANLAYTLWSLGDYPAAREMEEDVVTRYRRVLGEDHPYTIAAAANLASMLWSLGDYPAAREMEEDVVTRRCRVLGEDHPDTITAAAKLAAWRQD